MMNEGSRSFGRVAKRILQAEDDTRTAVKKLNWPKSWISGTPKPEPPVTEERTAGSYEKELRVRKEIIHQHTENTSREELVWAMRDIVIFVIYAALLLLINTGSLRNTQNYQSDVLSDLMTDSRFVAVVGTNQTEESFKTMRGTSNILKYIGSVLIQVLYADTIYWRSKFTLLLENVFVGPIVIRQVRVKRDTCQTVKVFQMFFHTCYDRYSYDVEDKEDFGTEEPFLYKRPTGNEYQVNGIAGTYGGGGFYCFLDDQLPNTQRLYYELNNGSWIRQGTRAVIVYLNIYSPSSGLICSVRLVFELPPTGGVITHSSFNTLKWASYQDSADAFTLSCQVAFIGFVAYWTFMCISKVRRKGWKYFDSRWNIVDFLIVCFSYATVAFHIRVNVLINNTLVAGLNGHGSIETGHFEEVVNAQMHYQTVYCLLCMLALLKTLQFLTLSRAVHLILDTFELARKELILLFLMYLVLSASFGFLGTALFGTWVIQFKNIEKSMVTLLGLCVGHFYYYPNCARVHPTLAPIFFAVFNLLVGVIFFNSFMAVIVISYSKASRLMGEKPYRLFFGDLFFSGLLWLLEGLWMRDLASRLRSDAEFRRNAADYDSFVEILHKYGWEWSEIGFFLDYHEIVRGDELNLDQLVTVYNDFHVREKLFFEVEGHNKLLTTIQQMETMAEQCRLTLVDVMSKSEILADKVLKSSRK